VLNFTWSLLHTIFIKSSNSTLNQLARLIAFQRRHISTRLIPSPSVHYSNHIEIEPISINQHHVWEAAKIQNFRMPRMILPRNYERWRCFPYMHRALFNEWVINITIHRENSKTLRTALIPYFNEGPWRRHYGSLSSCSPRGNIYSKTSLLMLMLIFHDNNNYGTVTGAEIRATRMN